MARFRPARRFEALEHRNLLAGDLLSADTADSVSHEPVAIISGDPVGRGLAPWMAALSDASLGVFCGGALIAADVVLTAAHCVEGVSADNLTVVLGREDFERRDGKEIQIDQIVVHSDYDAFTNDSDIALLFLTENSAAVPLPIVTRAQEDLTAVGVTATVFGYGATHEGGNIVTTLRQVSLPIVSNVVANQPSAYDGAITANMLPAGFSQGGKDACQGDSGGPMLVSDDAGTPHLAGVVSFGEGCARPNKYGIYTRVSAFDEWIETLAIVESAGVVSFTQDRFPAFGQATIQLQDADLGDTPSIDVSVRSDRGDVETVRLLASGNGRFRGSIPTERSSLERGDNKLNVLDDEIIRVDYRDLDHGNGEGAIVSDAARIAGDDFGNDPGTAHFISNLAPVRGEIEISGDVDVFEFIAQEGEAYQITVDLNGTLNDSVLYLVNEAGETLALNDDSGRGLGSSISYDTDSSGPTFIEVAGYGSHVGTYELSIQVRAPGNDDHGNGRGTASKVDINEAVDGEIEINFDVDWFGFQATHGTVYRVETELITLFDSRLRLFAADGATELAYNDDITDNPFGSDLASRLFWRADYSGNAFFQVAGYEQDTGAYRVSVSEVVDDHGSVATAASPIDESASQSGNIGPEDVDFFAFEVVAGMFYEFRTILDDFGGLSDSIITLYDTDGQTILGRNDDMLGSSASRFLWQAPADGTYFVSVEGYLSATGNYEVSIHSIAPPRDDFGQHPSTAVAMDVPGARDGRADYEGDSDWFQIQAISGKTYTITVKLRTLDDSVLRLFDTDGRMLLAENDDVGFPDRSSRLIWTADRSGPQYVDVAGFDGLRGTYTLDVRVESAVGDLNDDGPVDARDIDILIAAINTGSNDVRFDLSNDGHVNRDDVDALLNMIGTIEGDADLDGTVAFPDFLLLSNHFGREGGWAKGDFDGNGLIQFADFLALSNAFGQTISLSHA